MADEREVEPGLPGCCMELVKAWSHAVAHCLPFPSLDPNNELNLGNPPRLEDPALRKKLALRLRERIWQQRLPLLVFPGNARNIPPVPTIIYLPLYQMDETAQFQPVPTNRARQGRDAKWEGDFDTFGTVETGVKREITTAMTQLVEHNVALCATTIRNSIQEHFTRV